MTPQQNNNQLPPLTDRQKKKYNTFRTLGIAPERALSRALEDGEKKYYPLSDEGLDNLFVGKGGLVNEFAGGVADAFTFKGAKEQYEKDKNQFQSTAGEAIDPDVNGERARLGKQYADNKAPLTYGSAFAKGIGRAAFSVLETADDLTGEAVSATAAPILEDAINSDVGQYLIKEGAEFNERNGGVPGEILQLGDLFALTAAPKKATAVGLRNSIIRNGRRVVDQGIDSARSAGRLTDYFKPTAPNNPIATQIDEGFKGIEEVLNRTTSQTQGATTGIADQIADMKAMIRNGNVEDSIMPMLDDFDLTPEDRDLIATYLKNIDEAVNQEGATDIVEAYLSGSLDQLDSAAAGATSVITNLTDTVVDKTMNTIDNVRQVPAAIADRARGAIDRRINRIATTNTDQALENILELYKKGIVPGVKKKNKTIATISQIDDAVKRVVPELAKKYADGDVDLEDFANFISLEKKAIFSQIDEGLQAAGQAGRQLELQKIVDELDELAKSERSQFSPELRRAIDRARAELVVETPEGDFVARAISASGAQDLIADLNAALQPQFRGARTNADDVVDLLVLNNLRKLTDDAVDDLGSGTFKDLKAQYADLKKLEDDVVHRAVFEAQKGQGLSGLQDITSAADLAAGALSPAFLARSAGGFIGKEVMKSLNDKNELVRQMFLYGKNVDAPVRKGGAPINPVDDISEDLADYGFGFSPDSAVVKSIDDQMLKVDTPFESGVKVSDGEIDLFGTKAPLNSVESKILNDPNFNIRVDTKKTRTGRKSPKQPVAFYSRSANGITFVPRPEWPMARTLQTFYHEIGHAIDFNKRTFTKDYGAAGGVRDVEDFVRNTGWNIGKAERDTLAFERFTRMMKPTIDAYGLNDDHVKLLFRNKPITVEGVGSFKPQPSLTKYVRAEKEVFAESYSMYRLNPEKLKELSPRTHEFIEEIVNEGGANIGTAVKVSGKVENALDDVLLEAKKYKSFDEFENAYEAADLMDLSNPNQHRIGRIFAEADGEKIMDLPATFKEYADDLKYYPDSNVPNVSNGNKVVTVYRGTVEAQKELMPGDFVSFSKEYARSHNNGEKIIEMKIPAKDVIWQGNDFSEWIYSPKSIRDKYPRGLIDLWEKGNKK